jgi:hypothetical protein
MATLPSNEFKDLLGRKLISFPADAFKIILMGSGYVFDRANHNTYADVASAELTTGAGYTTGGQTLTGVTLTRDNVNNEERVTWNNASWLATGGDLVAQGAIIFDDTITTPSADPVIGYIDFGAPTTTFDSGNFTIANIAVIW